MILAALLLGMIGCAALTEWLGLHAVFGAFLAHATGPNHTTLHRRALLYSYQPPGLPHMLASLRKLAGKT